MTISHGHPSRHSRHILGGAQSTLTSGSDFAAAIRSMTAIWIAIAMAVLDGVIANVALPRRYRDGAALKRSTRSFFLTYD
jgi:hypothetical protein